MNYFIVSIKMPGEKETKHVSLISDTVSEMLEIIKERYINATIVSFIQK